MIPPCNGVLPKGRTLVKNRKSYLCDSTLVKIVIIGSVLFITIPHRT